MARKTNTNSKPTQPPRAGNSSQKNSATVHPLQAKRQLEQSGSSAANLETRPKAVKPRALAHLSPIRPGLTIIAMPEQSLLPDVRNMTTQQVLRHSKQLDIPMPEVDNILSLYSGNYRRLEQAKALDAANIRTKTGVTHHYEIYGNSEIFDWLSGEGICTLQPIIEEDKYDVVMLEQVISGQLTPTMTTAIYRINTVAQQFKVWVMLFLVHEDGYEKSRLHEMCTEYIEVARCQPDPDAEMAFLIDFVNLRSMNRLGIGRKMCNVKLVNGVFLRHYEQFISEDRKTRTCWYLRGHGKSYEEIGRIFHLDKSTISRRLKGLPPPVRVDKEWLSRYLKPSQAASHTSRDGHFSDGLD